eukprot:Sspe_Gene.22399::Locus_8523_Transcript_1_1_Confidence_1.000_Length_3186::g.22399::m.22399
MDTGQLAVATRPISAGTASSPGHLDSTDEEERHKGRGAPIPNFQRPSSSAAERMVPAPSVSKTGFMSELSIGTRQLAKASIIGMQKKHRKRVHKPPPIGVIVELDLDEFGKGLPQDRGRTHELLSSPREDTRVTKQVEHDQAVVKAKSFNRSMDLRFDPDGKPVNPPPPDPVDLRYQKYNIRRPWSSQTRARTCSDSGAEEGEGNLMQALDDLSHTSEEKRTRPSSCFVAPGYRYGYISFQDSHQPCIGQYNPRFTVVHRTPQRAPDWERSSRCSSPRVPSALPQPTRPNSAPPTKARPRSDADTTASPHNQSQAAPLSPTLGGISETLMSEGLATLMQKQGFTEEADTGAVDNHPNNFKRWVDHARAASARPARPTSSFLAPSRPPSGVRQSPGPYWPYDSHLKSSGGGVQMDKQSPRWTGNYYGYTAATTAHGGKAPDVVYKAEEPRRHVAVPRFELQVPRKGVPKQCPAAHVVYNTDPSPLSTQRSVKAVVFAKTSSRATLFPTRHHSVTLGGDAAYRKEIDPVTSYYSTQRSVQGAIPYDNQMGRPELLHPNPYVGLEYDPKYDAVHPRSPSPKIGWSRGHSADLFQQSAASPQRMYEPNDKATRRNTEAAPDMAKSTSRDHHHGNWRPTTMLDTYYNTNKPARVLGVGLKFERQLARERREAVLGKKLALNDRFYDPPRPRIKGTVPFEKVLSRHKRPPTKWLGAPPNSNDGMYLPGKSARRDRAADGHEANKPMQ